MCLKKTGAVVADSIDCPCLVTEPAQATTASVTVTTVAPSTVAECHVQALLSVPYI